MRTSKVLESPLVDGSDGTKSNVIALISQELRVGATFSFGRVTDKGSYRKYDFPSLPIRSPQLLEFSEMLDARLEGESPRNANGAGCRPRNRIVLNRIPLTVQRAREPICILGEEGLRAA